MNIIDAIKSGRPFRKRRISKDGNWFTIVTGKCGELVAKDSRGNIEAFVIGEIISDDWEIREPVVTITRTQLANAISAYIAAEKTASNFFEPAGNIYPDPVNFIARKLGLED